MHSRRQFGKAVAAGIGLSMFNVRSLLADAASDATVRGVKLGAITGAYVPFNLTGFDAVDQVIQLSIQTGAGHVEFVNTLIEPAMGGPCAMNFGAMRGGPGGPGGPGGGPGGAPGAGAGAPGGGPPAAGPGGAPGAGGRGGAPGRAGGFNAPCGIGGQVPTGTPPAGYQAERDKLRQWRLNADLDQFREIRKKFDAAGVDLFSYVMTIGDDFTDPEIDAVFRHMQALGVDKFCTNQTRVDMGPRIVPYAEKYKIRPAFHTHDLSQDPNEVSSPESLAKLLAMSPLFMVNFDIGHYWDGGNDPWPYFQQHHDRITHIHVRDSNKDRQQVDIGTGVLHVADMLRLTRDNKWDVAFIVEQNGRAGTTNNADALKANIDWMKGILDS